MQTDSGIEAIPAGRPAPPAFVHMPRPARRPYEGSRARGYGASDPAAMNGQESADAKDAHITVERFGQSTRAEVCITTSVCTLRLNFRPAELQELARCLIDAAADIEAQEAANATAAPACDTCAHYLGGACLHPLAMRNGVAERACWMRQAKNRPDGICGPQARLYARRESAADIGQAGVHGVSQAVERDGQRGRSEIAGAGGQHGCHEGWVALGVAVAEHPVQRTDHLAQP